MAAAMTSVHSPAQAASPRPIKSRQIETVGYQLTLIRAASAEPTVRRIAPAATDKTVTPTVLAEDKRECLSVTVDAEVHLGPVVYSLIKWRDGETGSAITALSNVDFRLLADPATYETTTHVFSWFPFVTKIEEINQPPADLFKLLSAEEPDYLLFDRTEAVGPGDPILLALDAVHAQVKLHRPKLEERRRERERSEEVALSKAQGASSVRRVISVKFWPLKGRAER